MKNFPLYSMKIIFINKLENMNKLIKIDKIV